jgi:hypothetical protein
MKFSPKTLLPASLAALVALLVVAQSQQGEQALPGALEKIAEALSAEPFAKPVKPRKLLVFSKTNGFRHASIATDKIALEEMWGNRSLHRRHQ